MSRNAGVLTMTDLRAESEQALVLAGRIAEHSGLLLDVLHPLGLRGLPLRDAIRELHGLDQRIMSIDRSIRALIRSHFPHWDHVPGPVIDVDNGPAALTRRSAQLKPPIVVLPACWNEGRRDAGAGGVAEIPAIPAPVLLVGSIGATRAERAILLRTEAPVQPVLRRAREWVPWFHAVCGPSVIPHDPSLDTAVVDAGLRRPAHAAIALHEPSLVLIPSTALDGPAGESMRETVSVLVRRQAHVLIMPDSAPPPLHPECELDRSLVAAEV